MVWRSGSSIEVSGRRGRGIGGLFKGGSSLRRCQL